MSRRRHPKREQSPCHNNEDYISRDIFYDEVDKQNIIYIHTDGLVHCYDITELRKYIQISNIFGNWVGSASMGHVGYEEYIKLPNGYQWVLYKDILNIYGVPRFQHFEAINIGRKNLADKNGRFDNKSPYDVYKLDPMYEDNIINIETETKELKPISNMIPTTLIGKYNSMYIPWGDVVLNIVAAGTRVVNNNNNEFLTTDEGLFLWLHKKVDNVYEFIEGNEEGPFYQRFMYIEI